MSISQAARERARWFLDREKEFHLGPLPTEQPHPATRRLGQLSRQDVPEAVRVLLSVDDDVAVMAARRLAEPTVASLRDAWLRAIRQGRRVFLTGCGATGRLCILLESIWRSFWDRRPDSPAGIASRVVSVMTGGDRALIRSVEGFEDYAAFGRRQVVEAGAARGDVVLAVTEGGETSSVIGTAWEGIDRGADVFLAFNNPAEILRKHVQRSRQIIEHPGLTVLDLATGPMAVAGSTRMQAVTAELLVIGAVMELVVLELSGQPLPPAEHFPNSFQALVESLRAEPNRRAIAGAVEFEADAYSRRGLITYLVDDYLLDLLTDTTERAPTFSLPAFRQKNDTASPASWAFVNNPLHPTPEAWAKALARPPRCLAWGARTYRDLGADEKIWRDPPKLGPEELLRFAIGSDIDPERLRRGHSALVVVEVADGPDANRALWDKADELAAGGPALRGLRVGAAAPLASIRPGTLQVACALPPSPIQLWNHLAVKLVFNTLSTLTMARMGRVEGNWMVYAEATNKKLIDRGTRLVAELTGLSYEQACMELHETIVSIQNLPPADRCAQPPAMLTIQRVKGRPSCTP